jgi:hypothetical protein
LHGSSPFIAGEGGERGGVASTLTSMTLCHVLMADATGDAVQGKRPLPERKWAREDADRWA